MSNSPKTCGLCTDPDTTTLVRPCNTSDCLNRVHQSCMKLKIESDPFKKATCKLCGNPVVVIQKQIDHNGVLFTYLNVFLAFLISFVLPFALLMLITCGARNVAGYFLAEILCYIIIPFGIIILGMCIHIDAHNVNKNYHLELLKRYGITFTIVLILHITGYIILGSNTFHVMTFFTGVIFYCAIILVVGILCLIINVHKFVLDKNSTKEYGVKLPPNLN